MSQALYRKYRSMSLDEVVGQEHITTVLANAIKEGRINHAYLFTGPRGTGKTSVARIMAHAINELEYHADQTHIDIIEIDAASNNGVEDVRELREKVLLAPTAQKYKVYIIDEVHMLSNAAFNALLKTLEEPPAHVVFILATTEVHKLPATILSRTQRFHFQPVAQKQVIAHLKNLAEKEKITIDDEALSLVAEFGEGSFRDSISLLDQLRGQKVDAAIVEKTLGVAPRKAIMTLIKHLQAGDTAAVIANYNELIRSGITPQTLSQQLSRILQQHAAQAPTLYALVERLIEVPRAYNPKVKLEVVLAQFSLDQQPQPTATTQTPTAPTQSQPVQPSSTPRQKQPETSTDTKVDIESPAAVIEAKEKPKEEQKTSTDTPTSVNELNDEQWQTIVAAAKASGPTLYTVIRQAIPHFDSEKQLLTLTFRFPLHQKRLEEQKYKQEFAKILKETLGTVPEIQIILNKNATKHITSASTKKSDAETAADPTGSVMDLMGGGEMVNV